MAKGKEPKFPKFHVGQVIAVSETRFVQVVAVHECGVDCSDGTWRGLLTDIRPLNEVEIGPTRKLKGER